MDAIKPADAVTKPTPVQVQTERPGDKLKAAPIKADVGESPPPAAPVGVSGKREYVNMEGQKIGSVINDIA
jgi:hypothetical protein